LSTKRFSFIAIEYEFGEKGFKEKQTASKRYTYLFGKGASLLIKPFSFKNHTNKIRVKRRIKLLWVWFSWFLSLGNLTCFWALEYYC
jgi:hypothetical protein